MAKTCHDHPPIRMPFGNPEVCGEIVTAVGPEVPMGGITGNVNNADVIGTAVAVVAASA